MSQKVYKTEEGKQASISLYEEQLRLLNTPYSDIYIDTDFGKTHLIETELELWAVGDPSRKPTRF